MIRRPCGGLWDSVVLLVVLTCVGGAFPNSSTARSIEEITASGELRACIAPTSSASAVAIDPACRENCEFTGPVPREVMAFAYQLGGNVRPVFNQVSWDELFHDASGKTDREGIYTPVLLESGKCDVYPSHLTVNDWRSKKLTFAILFESRMMVVVNKSRKAEFRNEADLAGKTVATDLNSSFHTWILEQNDSAYARNPIVVRLMRLEKALDAVERKEVDFTLVDSDTALWEAAHGHQNIAVAFAVGPRDEIGWAVSRKNQDLRDAIQKFFDSQSQVDISELNTIWKEEFGTTLKQFQALIQATR